MEPAVIRKGPYTYVHDVTKGPPEVIHTHHINVASSVGIYMFFKCALIGTICLVTVLHLKEKCDSTVLWSLVVVGLLLRTLLRKQVEKESVTILPAFGVQLETVYRSGKTVRQFVPIGKILKPVLNECVTPVTCYWSLSLILRGEEELLLVFKEISPPVTMLVPIWKALCAAIGCEESSECDTS